MTMQTTVGDPLTDLSLRRLSRDLAAAGVQVGVARGEWRIGELDYPKLMVVISASTHTFASGWVDLCVDVSGYPNQGVTACPWNLADGVRLAPGSRPTGGRATMVFRSDWENGRALYHPCDRVAIAGHPEWPREHADELWDPQQGIAKFLRLIHTILNEADHATVLDPG